MAPSFYTDVLQLFRVLPSAGLALCIRCVIAALAQQPAFLHLHACGAAWRRSRLLFATLGHARFESSSYPALCRLCFLKTELDKLHCTLVLSFYLPGKDQKNIRNGFPLTGSGYGVTASVPTPVPALA